MRRAQQTAKSQGLYRYDRCVMTGQSVTVTNDVSAPTVSSVSTSASDATYGIGDVIPILIQFNEVVNVVGTPTLALETGTTDATAYYASGTGTDTLTFNYTVASLHVAADLDYQATTSLTLPTSSDTIRDNLATNVTLTLAIRVSLTQSRRSGDCN